IAVLAHAQLHRAEVPVLPPEVLARLEEARARIAVLEQGAAAQQLPAEQQRQVRLQLRQATEVLRAAERQAPRRGRREGGEQPLPTAPADFVVVARTPQFAPAMLRLPPHALPAGIVELRVGATGALVVELVG